MHVCRLPREAWHLKRAMRNRPDCRLRRRHRTPHTLVCRALPLVLAALIILACFAIAESTASLHITVVDSSNALVPGAEVQLMFDGRRLRTGKTDGRGELLFSDLAEGSYGLVVSKQGLETVTKENVALTESQNGNLVLVLKVAAVKQEVNVEAKAESPVEQPASVGTEITGAQAKDIPGRPSVLDALPLVPGVVRSPDGQVHISGRNEPHSGFVVNSTNVTDPVTGQFEPTVPIDSVEAVSVYKTPYLARYGGFTAGIVEVDTRRGGEKWKYELNDPFPEFRIRSHHFEGVKEVTPRVSIAGPVIPGKLYFSEGFEYEMRKQAVRSLQFPFNESRLDSYNSFSQLDYVASAKHILTFSFHGVPLTRKFATLSFFNPQPVTPNFDSDIETTSLNDRMMFHSGQLQSTVSFSRISGDVSPQGNRRMFITPTGNRGNYYSQRNRNASRTDWRENFALQPIKYAGTHNLEFGTVASRTEFRGLVRNRTVDVLDNSNQLVKRVEFINPGPIRRQDLDVATFVQDHWVLNSKVALDAGVRLERQALSEVLRPAPRAGFVFTPWTSHTVVRGGYGVFYDTVPLNVFAFDQLPGEIITTYGDVPVLYHRILSTKRKVLSRTSTLDETNGRFSPSSAAWNIEVEHAINRAFQVRANYLENNSEGLFILNREDNGQKHFLALRDTGHSFYRQLELGARYVWKQGEVSGSYVHSRAVGDLNEFDTFLGAFPVPIIPTNKFAHLPGDIPNRALLWGQFRLPIKVRLTPLVEFRTGFPYQIRNVLQDYIATNRDTRFPNYFSLNTRVSRDFQVSRKYALEASVSLTNITDHFNPLEVHANNADPQFGRFFAYYDRRARFDLEVKF